MKVVRVFGMGPDFKSREIGTIILDDGSLRVSPESSVDLRAILRTPVGLPVRGVPHRVTVDQPELFLEALHSQYRSAALRCGPPENIDNISESDWDESKHPREPAGSAAGGEFASSGTSSAGSPGTATVKKNRIAGIRDEAANIPITNDLVKSPAIDEDEYDEIDARLSPEESARLQEHLDQKRAEEVERAMKKFTPDISDEDVEESADWTAGSVRENAAGELESLYEPTDDEMPTDALLEIVNEWESDSGGVNGIDELAKFLKDKGAPDQAVEIVDGLRGMAQKALDKHRLELEQEQEYEARSSAEQDFNEDPAREQWLRRFHREHPERFESSLTLDKWGRDENGVKSFSFKTKSGEQFELWAARSPMAGIPATQVAFSDANGDYKITGKAGPKTAAEVFRKVTTAVTALLLKDKPPVVSFTAAEPNRQRLYDRLVRTTAEALPDYHAVAIPGSPRTYILARRDQMADLEKIAAARGAAIRPEVLAESQGEAANWILLDPQSREEWFLASGWKSPETDRESAAEQKPEK